MHSPTDLKKYRFTDNPSQPASLDRTCSSMSRIESHDTTTVIITTGSLFLFLSGWLLVILVVIPTARQCISLGGYAFLSALARGLGLGPLGVHFVLEDALTLFLGFGFVDLSRWLSDSCKIIPCIEAARSQTYMFD